MASMKHNSSNEVVLEETQNIQECTKDALYRIQRQTALTEELGNETLTEIHKQGEQLHNIRDETNHAKALLDSTKKLQNRFDWWYGHWFGIEKREAELEAERRRSAMNKRQTEQRVSLKNTTVGKASAAAENDLSVTTVVRSRKFRKTKVVQRTKVKSVDAYGITKNTRITNNEISKLSDHERDSLDKVHQTDKEIDAFLDKTSESVNRLLLLSKQIHEETTKQTKELDDLDDGIEDIHSKTLVASGRVKRVLVGPWAMRA